MKPIMIAFPGNESMADKIGHAIQAEQAHIEMRNFPDGEAYVRLLRNVALREVIVVATLHRPDDKFLPLVFLLRLLRESGAKKITLVSPYLAYMRQDKQFHPGEAVTSTYFAGLLSSFIDALITIDPHLHRRNSMSEIYTVLCTVLHAAPLISAWIKDTVNNPFIIGPDSESEQWVSEVAVNAGAPHLVLQKERFGDRNVKVSLPDISRYNHHTPVLVDDIISTAHTMIETVKNLKHAGMKPPVCMSVHGVFSGQAFNDLMNAGAARVVTSNTIPHPSNQLDVSPLIIKSLIKP